MEQPLLKQLRARETRGRRSCFAASPKRTTGAQPRGSWSASSRQSLARNTRKRSAAATDFFHRLHPARSSTSRFNATKRATKRANGLARARRTARATALSRKTRSRRFQRDQSFDTDTRPSQPNSGKCCPSLSPKRTRADSVSLLQKRRTRVQAVQSIPGRLQGSAHQLAPLYREGQGGLCRRSR